MRRLGEFGHIEAQDAVAHKNVLVLYGERLDLPAVRQVEQTFHDQFGEASSPTIDMFPEYFDFARFPSEQSDTILAPYLRGRYAGKKIDLVLTVTGMALDFALRHREELFPGVPIVFMVMDPKDVDASHLPVDVAGVAVHADVAGTLALALRLQPERQGDRRRKRRFGVRQEIPAESVTYSRQFREQDQMACHGGTFPCRNH